MEHDYFVLDGIKYVITYDKDKMVIFKYIDDKLQSLSEDEYNKIKLLLNKNDGYVYSSELLDSIIDYNPNIENKDYVKNFLVWLEGIIPEQARENLYKNLTTLKTDIKASIDLNQLNNDLSNNDSVIVGGYNTTNNSLTIKEESLKTIWKIAQSMNDPESFYWSDYGQTLLHELTHMASSKYDEATGVSLCGFDKYPPENENDRNRGLTEGMTEVIAISGVSTQYDISSGYYEECCIINQLRMIIGNDVILDSYFTNKGIVPLQEKLNALIENKDKSYNLFRSIELNFDLKNYEVEQNVLGQVQRSLLDYLDKKLDLLMQESKYDEIKDIINRYRAIMMDSEKLVIRQKNPDLFLGVEASVNKFNKLKDKYESLINEIENNNINQR